MESPVHAHVVEVLVETFDTPRDDVRPDSRLGEDLGFDSISTAELFEILAKHWNVELDETGDIAGQTVEELVAQVEKGLPQPREGT